MERKRNASGTFKKEYSDKQLLDFIKNKFNEIGEVPRINNFKKYKFPSLLTWYRRFGSYTNAVKLCNLPPRKRGAQFKIDKMSRSDISKKYYSTPKGIFNVIKKNEKNSKIIYKTKMAKTAIIIPFINLSWMTISCIKSIVDNTHREQYVLYLENNNSDENETRKIIDFLHTIDIDYVHTIHSSNLGFVRATNSGIGRALSDGCSSVMFLNNDTIVTPGWLSRMVEVLNSDKKIGIVGPMTTPPSWRDMPKVKEIISKRMGYELLKPQIDGYSNTLKSNLSGMTKDQDFLAFYCVLIKREMIDDVGILSEDYDIGLFDDDDYCYRANNAGWRIVLAQDVYVHHYHNSTFIELNIDYKKQLEKNRKVFINKHGFDPWDRVNAKIEKRNQKTA